VTDGERLVVIASSLTAMEAGLLRGLLESAGIDAAVTDTATGTRAVLPGLPGARLVVRAADAERATEIVRSAGALPGPSSDEPADIPEEEWSRGAAPGAVKEAPSSAGSRPAWPWPAMLAALFVLLLLLALARW
jgi:hypothetical protein